MTDDSELLSAFAILLNDDDEFLPNINAHIDSIFSQFDIDDDKVLNTEELNAFCEKTNGKPFDKESLEEIRLHFNCDANGGLTRIGFGEMLITQTLSDPLETLKDLRACGINI